MIEIGNYCFILRGTSGRLRHDGEKININQMKNLLFLAILALNVNFANAQWQKTNCPYYEDGWINCFASKGTNIFVGTTGIGLSRSTDNGNSWTTEYICSSHDDIDAIAISGNNIFVGTFGSGVFLSTNDGNTWDSVNTGLTEKYISSLAIIGTKIFAGTWDGVFMSSNNGNNWVKLINGLHTHQSALVLAISDTNIFMGTNGDGVFRSTDYGKNWIAVNNGLSNTFVYSIAVNGTNIFAGTLGGVFLSTNNGNSWIKIFDIINHLNDSTNYSFAFKGKNIFLGSFREGVFLSTNNGNSWTPVNIGFNGLGIWSLSVIGTNLFAGTYYDGVWKRPISEMDGISETKSNDVNFNLYPNPGSGKFKIEVNHIVSDKINLEIYSLYGEKIYEVINLKQFPNEIDLSGFPKGVYLVKLFEGANFYTEKIVIQ